VIKDSIEKAFIKNAPILTTDDILTEIRDTKPMSESLKDKIEHLTKSLEKLDVKKASNND